MASERTEQRRRYSPHEIRKKLDDADGALATGQSVSSICERLGITRQTYYRWRRSLDSLASEAGATSGSYTSASNVNVQEPMPPLPRRIEPGSLERLRFLELENQRLRDAVIALLLEKMSLTK